jgi:hypothetical protein
MCLCLPADNAFGADNDRRAAMTPAPPLANLALIRPHGRVHRMAVFLRLESIAFEDPAGAIFVFETDDGIEVFRFSRELVKADDTDAMVAATAGALAADLRAMSVAAEQYAAAVASGAKSFLSTR